MFFKGILLDDHAGVLEEVGPNSHAARRMTFTSVEDVQSHAEEELTPGRQRAYNLHVSGAKQTSTRARRVDKIVPRIRAGKGLRDG
jgi:uncharacterized protein YdeI (YjbR/CyaY-like superfamily)